MQYSPPPLFKQGASARAKVVFFAILAIFLLVVDSRFKSLERIRFVVGTILYPVQMVAVVPRDAMLRFADYFVSTSTLEKENAKLKRQQISNADVLQQTGQLAAENAHLRKLLDARERLTVKSLMGEIIYDARDPFTRKIILDKGVQHGVALSQPVIDDLGVVGQVTRVFPLTSEVTLLTDKNQAIPVQIARNGIRSVVSGRGQSSFLDMRMTTNADVQNGDLLVTSGIDGVYPAGLAVAKVVQVENKASTTFENVLCSPSAGIDRHRQLLILMVETDHLTRPDTEEIKAKKEKINRRVTRDSAKEMVKETDSALEPKLPAAPAPAAAQTVTPTPAATPAVTPAVTPVKAAQAPASKEIAKALPK
ncbi:rod shape-determining protein MreC [Undibacterium piscinae]|uniref:Cell shape-determining protein MreC n=1 Tax=Undibacterium piscinae TaxID=2495591 RepID=A0A6M4A452_9BURK|nr:rod shape-determining protein MreC [Undibacterium piscinae]